MAATYDSSLPTDKDKVRTLIGDTEVSPESKARLSDESIQYTLDIQRVRDHSSTPLFAAADCLSIIIGKYSSEGRGAKSSDIDDIKVIFGTDVKGLEVRMRDLRMQAEALLNGNVIFECVGQE
jgi:hypothetical protein